MDAEDLVRFIHESGSLKLLPRAGWLRIGIKMPESVAEHSFRTAVIAFILALEEGDFEKACRAAAAALFHDMPEARTLDLDRVARRYVNADENKAIKDQLSMLNVDTSEFSDVMKYVEDADALELAFQAVEYSLINRYAIRFAEGLSLKTEVAKRIHDSLMSYKEPVWWK